MPVVQSHMITARSHFQLTSSLNRYAYTWLLIKTLRFTRKQTICWTINKVNVSAVRTNELQNIGCVSKACALPTQKTACGHHERVLNLKWADVQNATRVKSSTGKGALFYHIDTVKTLVNTQQYGWNLLVAELVVWPKTISKLKAKKTKDSKKARVRIMMAALLGSVLISGLVGHVFAGRTERRLFQEPPSFEIVVYG